MMLDYYYYRLGCEAKGIRPLTRLRFDIAFGRYQREHETSVATIAAASDHKARRKLVARWTKLARIAAFVHRGKIIDGEEGLDLVAAGFGGVPVDDVEYRPLITPVASPTPRSTPVASLDSSAPNFGNHMYPRPSLDDGPPPEAPGGTGVREPRRPIAPTLVGAAARALPASPSDYAAAI